MNNIWLACFNSKYKILGKIHNVGNIEKFVNKTIGIPNNTRYIGLIKVNNKNLKEFNNTLTNKLINKNDYSLQIVFNITTNKHEYLLLIYFLMFISIFNPKNNIYRKIFDTSKDFYRNRMDLRARDIWKRINKKLDILRMDKYKIDCINQFYSNINNLYSYLIKYGEINIIYNFIKIFGFANPLSTKNNYMVELKRIPKRIKDAIYRTGIDIYY